MEHSLKTISRCPICNSENPKRVFSAKDYTVSEKTFHIDECQTCGFWFTNPIPDIKGIGDYYKSEDYISHTDEKGGLMNTLYRRVRNRNIQAKLELINKLSKKGELLDIGCGTGDFLKAASVGGWAAIGLEPDPDARKLARQKSDATVEDINVLHSFDEGSFDVITMWHVLEHVYNLQEDFKKICSVLKPGGKVVIAVPNRLSYDAQKYGEKWAAYDVPRHLYHFRELDIKNLAAQHGLIHNKTYPMKWDAYYVSMLSSEYSGKNKWLGLLTGLKSNMKATPATWSSQIYVLTKKRN